MARLEKLALKFQHMIDEVEWSTIHSKTASNKANDEEIRLSFKCRDKKDPYHVDFVEIRIGKGILDEMGWKHKDQIVVFADKRGSLNFKLCKTEVGKGYKISHGVSGYTISFKWKEPIKLYPRKMEPVDFYVKNNELLIFSAEAK